MKRKIVKHGSSTLTVSLPSKWAKKNNLKQGDELELVEQGNNYLIAFEKKEEAIKEISIELTESARQNRRFVHNAYRAGFNTIILKNIKDKSIVQNILSQMIGFEAVSQTETTCTLKEIAKISFDEFDSLFNRYFMILMTMHKEMVDAIKDKRYDNYKIIYDYEKLHGKIYSTCMRLINKNNESFARIDLYSVLIHKLENMSDLCKYISKIINDKKVDNKKIIVLLEQIYSMLELLYKQYNNYSYSVSDKLYKDRLKYIEEATSIIKSCDKTEIELVHYLLDYIMECYYCDSFMIGIYFSKKKDANNS